MTEEKKQSPQEILRLLCEAYNKELLGNGEVAFELTEFNIQKLDTIVKTVYSSFFGPERFSSDQEKAAAFFCLIIKDHPFTDGNKRMATLWLDTFSVSHGLPITSKIPLDELAVSVERSKTPNVDHIVWVMKIVLFDPSIWDRATTEQNSF